MQYHEKKFWEQVMTSTLPQLLSIEHRFISLHL